MIKEVLVVEGKMDVVAIDKAVEADCIITEGFNLLPRTIKNIKAAYEKRGIIILTDPDSAGERIRTYLTRRFPKAKHAFIPCEEATANNDIGIEQASPESIRKALAKVRTMNWQPSNEFSATDLILHRLNGFPNASLRRAKLGEILGIGFANAKTFVRRLNNYGITREEFNLAMQKLDGLNNLSKENN